MSNFTSIPTVEYEKLCNENTTLPKVISYLTRLLQIETKARKRLERFIEENDLTTELVKEVING